MARKKWVAKEEITPELLKFREKRKWQISLRRYVLNRHPCAEYAPYFGLDIANMRQWFEYQFENGLGWDNFAKMWQFDHIIPVTYFDFSKEEELKLCWNFTNIRVERYQPGTTKGNRMDLLAAKNYFRDLYDTTQYPLCEKLLHKIEEIEQAEMVSTDKQRAFINDHREYLDTIGNYSVFEFELLNAGRSVEDVKKEIAFLKNLKNQP
ncbi:MAG: hypothetical protein NTW29_17690 [Bacteroidetes bacterium]|nr:hypothetical protein [Bacteroidota bacterium]